MIPINWREVCQNALAERQKLSTNPLTTSDGLEFTFNDIYVPLGLVEKVKKEKRPGEVSPEEGSQFYQPEEVTRTYKNDEFFAQVLKQGQSPKSQGRRLAVTGEPGAGKTTLLQKIAQWVAAETEQDVAIWVSLADLQGRSVEEYLLQKWLKDALEEVEVTLEMKKALALLFKSGRVWLLLDGVDEMGSSNPLATVKNQISGWVASARVVVTCRQNVWDAGKNALEGFDVYRNLDFDYPEGVGQFIQRWFARHPELGERLLAELAQDGKERIRDTVRNPLRLALLCCAWQTRQGGLPETKAGLYKQFAKALYKWKEEKEKFHTNSQQRKDLNAALGRLALRGMEQPESRFRLREGLVTEVLGETDEPLCQLALDLGWLNLVGVAVENPDERVYAFYHPTFQEYFAALAVDDWGYFLHHVPDNPSLGTYRIFEKQWKEVILLWFGRGDVQKEKKEAFVKKLINFDDGCGDWNYPKVDRGFYEYRAYFLAGAIVPEFKESRFADEIVSRIFQWSYVGFIAPITEEAKAILAETDKERAIPRLIQLLDQTSDEDTRRSVADILGEIAGGNELAIQVLIRGLKTTKKEKNRYSFAYSLMKIAPGNKLAILELILLLKTTNNGSERRIVAEILGKISPKNELAIGVLILLLKTTDDQYNRSNLAWSLWKIDPANELAIRELIQAVKTTKYFRYPANILGEIAVKNELAIRELILLLKKNDNECERRIVANILGKIAVGNKAVIKALIQVFKTTNDISIANCLWKIYPRNKIPLRKLIGVLKTLDNEYQRVEFPNMLTTRKLALELLDMLRGIIYKNKLVIMVLIVFIEYSNTKLFDLLVYCLLLEYDLFKSMGEFSLTTDETNLVVLGLTRILKVKENKNEDKRIKIVQLLGEIAPENELAIQVLIRTLETTDNQDNRKWIANSLGKIDPGNELAIRELIRTLETTDNQDNRKWIANSLAEIALGNELAIGALIVVLKTTDNQYTRSSVAESLGKMIKTEKQYTDVVFTLNHNLTDEVYENNFEIYEKYYKLLWQCAQNLTYPKFYQAWHHQLTSTHPEAPDNIPVAKTTLTQSLEIQITDILTQLQPTTQTYPLPINIQSLADETDTSVIYQELCTLIYSLALPDTDIPTVSNFAQLKQQIPTLKKQLQKRNLALILHNCKPHPPLLTCCRKIADTKLGLHILWITDEPLEPPLRGFPPSQDNLLGAMQTWIEKSC